MKVKGFSLQGTLMIMLFASIIMGSLLLLSRVNNSLYSHAYLQSLLLSDIESAVNIAMNASVDEDLEDSVLLNFHSPVTYRRLNWGLFDVIQAEGRYLNTHMDKTGLYSLALPKDKFPVLHIIGGHNALSVAGTTLLKGDIYCPNKQVKRAFIEGKSYLGKELYYGTLFEAKDKPLLIDKSKIGQCIQKLQKRIVVAEKIPLSALYDSLSNPFSSPTLCISSEQSIVLRNSVKGNVIIHSEEEIVVEEGALLDNCILNAPVIRIYSGGQNRFQAFAENKIEVKEGATLLFPSCLVTSGSQESVILLEDDVLFQGNIIALKEHMTFPETLIHLSASTSILGLIHSNGCVQLRGRIDGAVACQKLLLKTASSLYENVLMDTELFQENLPKWFPCSYIEGEQYSIKKLIEVE